MIVWVVDFIGFLLLCVGSKLAAPWILRFFCRIAVLYVLIFTICYYFWLIPRFRYFEEHPHFSQTGISMAFKFQGFWSLLGNMVLLQGIFPVAVFLTLFLAVKWLSAGIRVDVRR